MSIGTRIAEALDWIADENYEAALIPTSIAVDATAARVYPAKKNNEAYKDWLHDNLALITKIGLGVSITSSWQFKYSHPDLRPDPQGRVSIEQILYHVVRCGLLHKAQLPPTLRFGPPGMTTLENGVLVLTGGVIQGLITAVVVSKANAAEQIPDNYAIVIGDEVRTFQSLWGNEAAINQLLSKPTGSNSSA